MRIRLKNQIVCQSAETLSEPTWADFAQSAADRVAHMVKVGLTLAGRVVRAGVRWIIGRYDAAIDWWEAQKPEVHANNAMKWIAPTLPQIDPNQPHVGGLNAPAVALAAIAGICTLGYIVVGFGVVQGGASVVISLASYAGSLCCNAEHLATLRAPTGKTVPVLLMIGSIVSFVTLRNNMIRAFAGSADGLVSVTTGRRFLYGGRFVHKISPFVKEQLHSMKKDVMKAWRFIIPKCD